VKVGVAAVASATTVESLAFAKGAFVFGSVDLEDMSKYGGWGATCRTWTDSRCVSGVRATS
jgi:hypothetical protein